MCVDMKTYTLASIAAVTFLVINTAPSPAMAVEKPGWLRRTFGTLTWEEVQTTLTTPKDICTAVRRHVRYRKDLEEEWTSGKETWDRGYGACEDYAACVVDLCKALGIEAQITVLIPRGSWEGHAVAIGTWKGKQWVSSNGWYEEVDSTLRTRCV